jgi:heterotetrameric sarcosine oxidase delta subunit
MLRIRCPYCGERDEVEFRYRGDASASRPSPDDDASAFDAYVFERANPRGRHVEWWLHVGGCRALLKVVRHTLSHEIHAIGAASEIPLPPPDESRK